MPVKINIDPTRVQMKIERTVKTGIGLLAREILNDCNQYCKEETGILIASSYIFSRFDDGLLIWQTPYARRQYYEIQTAYKDYNPNATWKWCEVAKSRHKAEWARKAQKITEMMGG